MPLLYVIPILLLLLIIARFSYTYFSMKKKYPAELFDEALRNENNGNFEAAAIIYETALGKFKTSRFHSNLKNRTIKKIKVLHSIAEYKNNLRFIR